MLSQNYIVEIKQYQDGSFEHNVNYVWDDDADKAMLKAEAKFHEILAQAAVSDKAVHAAILFTSEGFPCRHECYKHDPIPVVEEPVEEIPAEEEPTEG